MKRTMFLLSALLVAPLILRSQSTIEFQSGTTIEVTIAADICADNVIFNGNYSLFAGTKCGGTVGVESALASVPMELSLSQNYPNPFNPTTTVQFTLPKDGRVTVRLYDLTGRQLATLLDEEKNSGHYHQLTIDAARFGSGTYFLTLEFNGKQLTKKLVLVK